MNSKERVIRALSGLQPDRVPIQEATIDVLVLWDIARTLGLDTHTQAPSEAQQPEAIQFEQSTEILDLTRRVSEALEFDSVFSGPTAGWSKLDPRHIRDRFGCIYRLSDYGAPMNVDGPIKGPDDLRGFDMASKREPNQFVDEVVQTVQETIRKAAPGGGYLLMSSNSIMPGCKAENVIAMFRAAREFGSNSDAIDTRPAVS